MSVCMSIIRQLDRPLSKFSLPSLVFCFSPLSSTPKNKKKGEERKAKGKEKREEEEVRVRGSEEKGRGETQENMSGGKGKGKVQG